MTYQEITEILNKERLSQKKSFAQVANDLNMSNSTVNHFFKNTRIVNFDIAYKIINYLGYDFFIVKNEQIEKSNKKSGIRKIVTELYLEGLSPVQISKKHNICVQCVHDIIYEKRQLGIIPKKEKLPHKFEKFSETIENLINQGIPLKDVLKEINFDNNNSNYQSLSKFIHKKGFRSKKDFVSIYESNSQEIKKSIDLGLSKSKIFKKLGLESSATSYKYLALFLQKSEITKNGNI